MEQHRNAKHTFSAQRLGRQAQGMRQFLLNNAATIQRAALRRRYLLER